MPPSMCLDSRAYSRTRKYRRRPATGTSRPRETAARQGSHEHSRKAKVKSNNHLSVVIESGDDDGLTTDHLVTGHWSLGTEY